MYSSSSSRPLCPSIKCFRKEFPHKMWPVQIAILLFIVCTTFLSSLTHCNTSSFLTWSAQLIFSILLHHHLLKLSRYFWSTFWSVKVPAPHKALLQMKFSLVCYLNLSPNCWWKEFSSFWMLIVSWQSWINFPCISGIIYYHTIQLAETVHILRLSLFYHNMYGGCLLWDSHHLSFFPHFHSTGSSNCN